MKHLRHIHIIYLVLHHKLIYFVFCLLLLFLLLLLRLLLLSKHRLFVLVISEPRLRDSSNEFPQFTRALYVLDQKEIVLIVFQAILLISIICFSTPVKYTCM